MLCRQYFCIYANHLISSLKSASRRVYSSTTRPLGRQMVRSKMDTNLKARPNPVVTILDSAEFKAVFTPELEELVRLFRQYNYEIRIAGGAVRDLVLKMIPTDIDFATTATPVQMKAMFEQENVRMINTNGEKHGTITPRINNAINFEVTTLRVDILTDGRHAEVEFTTDWLLDANRRDLTINSMFLGFDGSIYDYFYGYEDLLKRHVAFVGCPEQRIKEDYLRILRYFRFYGRIADNPDKHDKATLEAITKNAAGLQQVSGERIWMELRKILQGNFAGELIVTLLNCGVGKYIGLPAEPNLAEFERVWKNQKACTTAMEPMTLLSALLSSTEDSLKLNDRLKFSAYERDLSIFLTSKRDQFADIRELLSFQTLCLLSLNDAKLIKLYIQQLLLYHGKTEMHTQFSKWTPTLPVSGKMLKEHGCPTGKIMGTVLSKLKVVWAESEFKADADELLARLPDILKELNVEDGVLTKKAKT